MRIVLLVALMLFPAVAESQMVAPKVDIPVVVESSSDYITVYYGVLMPAAREYLESRWTDDPKQLERGYCVGAVSYNSNWEYDTLGQKIGRDVVARVWSVFDATVVGATPSGIENLECPDGSPHIHTHPPTTCEDAEKAASCVYGGMNAWQCQPSRTDLITLVEKGDRFAIVQCDRHSFRFYWPSEYRPDAVASR